MLYDIPGRTGVRIGTATLLRLADAPADRRRQGREGRPLRAARGHGRDRPRLLQRRRRPQPARWLAHGAAGVVSVVGHVAARAVRAMVRAVDAGDLATARRVHTAAPPGRHAVMTRTQGAITAKAALQLQGVLPTGTDAPAARVRHGRRGRAAAHDLSQSGVL